MVFVGYYCCHSLRGLCGLKCRYRAADHIYTWSQPARAVWIEIAYILLVVFIDLSQPARAVWIEITVAAPLIVAPAASQPARAVWIEMATSAMCCR